MFFYSKVIRKAIARVKTVITQSQRKALRSAFKDSKYLPLDLREKKTRALRRALTKDEKNATTERQKKKNNYFPKRKYALKA